MTTSTKSLFSLTSHGRNSWGITCWRSGGVWRCSWVSPGKSTDGKLTLQLTREELSLVTATLLGLVPRRECKNHGPNNDKGLEIEHQGSPRH